MDRQSGIRLCRGMGGHIQRDRVRGQRPFSRAVKVSDLVEATAQPVHTRSQQYAHHGNRPLWERTDRLPRKTTVALMIFVAMGPDQIVRDSGAAMAADNR